MIFMLNLKVITFKFKKSIKTGLYVDYLVRLLGKIGLLNGFIWSGLYVCEKLFIEYVFRLSPSISKKLLFSNTSPLSLLNLTIRSIIIILVIHCILYL